jgi:signal peptide peptidase SppA
MQTIPKYWLGTQESSDQMQAAVERYAAAQDSGQFKASGLREEFGLPPLLSIQAGVGVVHIAGPLVPGPASGIILWGATGYDEIRQAVAEALNNPEVQSIMLHIASGGGAVSGVEDLGTFLKMAGKMKPLTTYADGVMASAAYWLGSYGSHISTSRTSILGSLGVLMVHMDRSEQLAQNGIKATVIRAGKYKALGNSVEPLSDVAKEELEAQARGIYDVFMGVVSDNRDVTLASADAEFGQGREFLGKDAVKVGLADAIMSYDQALMHAKSLAKASGAGNNPGKFKGASAMKVTLTAEQLAAYAAGSTLVELGFAADAVMEPAGENDGAPANTQPSTEMVALTEQVTALTAQVATATAASEAAQAEAVAAKAQADAAAATHDSLLAIARSATGGLLIRLGGSGEDAASMDAATVVAAHAKATETMNTRFRVGGLSKPVGTETEVKPVVAVSHRHQAMVAYGPQARQAAAAARK